MQGPPGVCGRAEVVFPSNLGFFLRSGNLCVFPKGGVSEGNPLLFASLACPGESIAASQDREPGRNQQMPWQDKTMDQRQLIQEKTPLDWIVKKCPK